MRSASNKPLSPKHKSNTHTHTPSRPFPAPPSPSPHPQGKNWLSESDGSNAWLLHLCLLWENERKEGSVLACAWNHDSISVHNYKHMVSCVAFVAKSCAHEGGRSRFESMEDEAVAALSMMPVKTDDKGDVAVSIAADSRVSLADIEAGLESITKR